MHGCTKCVGINLHRIDVSRWTRSIDITTSGVATRPMINSRCWIVRLVYVFRSSHHCQSLWAGFSDGYGAGIAFANQWDRHGVRPDRLTTRKITLCLKLRVLKLSRRSPVIGNDIGYSRGSTNHSSLTLPMPTTSKHIDKCWLTRCEKAFYGVGIVIEVQIGTAIVEVIMILRCGGIVMPVVYVHRRQGSRQSFGCHICCQTSTSHKVKVPA